MSTEDNKALVRRGFEETLNQRNLEMVDELHIPNFAYHSAAGTIQGREPFKQFLSMLLSAVPDLQVIIEDILAEGDRVACRFTIHGTHAGNLMGIPPTGKQVTVSGIDISRVANGKFLEEWIYTDLMQQLGVTSTPG